MVFRDDLAEVARLQKFWVKDNTPEMKRRGELIRHDLPDAIETWPSFLRAARRISDLQAEGRDGTGLKTEIPWVRVFSESRSPHATDGWYLVYLVDAPGDAVSLSLNQGTTQWNGADFVPRPPEVLEARVRWARGRLSSEDTSGLAGSIALDARRSHLGEGYERGNVFAVTYETAALPSQERLDADLDRMLALLSLLYEAETTRPAPGDLAPEQIEATDAVSRVAGRIRRHAGQGRQLDAGERKAVEDHAMSIATERLKADGWRVKDVSRTESYDLHCSQAGDVLHVEVKGTTTEGRSVILTPNEVALARAKHPRTMLLVVYDIDLTRSDPPATRGGLVHITHPFCPEDEDLEPLGYTYTLPS